MVKYLPDERKIFIYTITKERERLLQQVGFLRMMHYKFEGIVFNFFAFWVNCLPQEESSPFLKVTAHL